MTTIKQMAEMTGFKENDLAQWLEIMAVEMSSGADRAIWEQYHAPRMIQ